jgi:hypothetical protein
VNEKVMHSKRERERGKVDNVVAVALLLVGKAKSASG